MEKKDEQDMTISIVEPHLSEERLQMGIKVLNAGTWALDLSTNSLIITKRCREILPICNEDHVKVSDLCEFIPATYGKKVVEAFLLALKTGSSFDMELPICPINNSAFRWLRITGAVANVDQNAAPKLYGIVEDISERKNNEYLKQDFLAMVSHDLKSPLSVIKLYMQLCGQLTGNTGDDRIAGILKKVELQVHKMNRLIECYLDSSVMVAGKTKLFPLMFDIRALLKEVIDDLHVLHPGQIIFLKPSPYVGVYADREKIGQVIQNLLSNAIKYSSSIDVITVCLKKTAGYLQVAITDHGIGINSADQEKIFDRFYRVDGKKGTTVKGYGLGLYLSREIIKQHNGNIWLESEINKGSRFYFTLPLPE